MSGPDSRAEAPFELVGGRLCLDFANTVTGWHDRDRLLDYQGLVDWGRQAGALDEPQARRLLAEARRRPREAEAVLQEGRRLRDAIYDVFLAFARGGDPAEAGLATLGEALGRALAHRRLRRGGTCCALGWEEAPGALDAVLWPVAASAAEVLVSDRDLERVRVCGLYDSQECSWLFVDETKSHTRRWCTMKDCGNRAKARRHYQRMRGG